MSDRNLFFTGLEVRKFKIQGLANLISGKEHLLGR
jgi:hypothetical protein